MVRGVGLLVLAALSGCGSLGVGLEGTIPSRVLAASASTEARPLDLAFDRLGNLTVNGQVLELPAAREHRHFGVGFVDAGALPPVWRPTHAAGGGVLVSWLHKASPLAVAGLRPFDRIEAVRALRGVDLAGGPEAIAAVPLDPVAHPAELAPYLGQVGHSGRIELAVVKPDGRRARFAAEAADAVADAQTIGVPLLFDRHAGTAGHAFGFGPLDGVFYYRALTDHAYVDDAARGYSTYRDRFEWGALFNLVLYERRRDVYTGEERTRLRLFGLHLWDDLEEGS